MRFWKHLRRTQVTCNMALISGATCQIGAAQVGDAGGVSMRVVRRLGRRTVGMLDARLVASCIIGIAGRATFRIGHREQSAQRIERVVGGAHEAVDDGAQLGTVTAA